MAGARSDPEHGHVSGGNVVPVQAQGLEPEFSPAGIVLAGVHGVGDVEEVASGQLEDHLGQGLVAPIVLHHAVVVLPEKNG